MSIKDGINPYLPASRIKEIGDRQRHFKSMTADDYARELTDLIEEAGTNLKDAESTKVLGDAFILIKTRLGITIQSNFKIPMAEGDPV